MIYSHKAQNQRHLVHAPHPNLVFQTKPLISKIPPSTHPPTLPSPAQLYHHPPFPSSKHHHHHHHHKKTMSSHLIPKYLPRTLVRKNPPISAPRILRTPTPRTAAAGFSTRAAVGKAAAQFPHAQRRPFPRASLSNRRTHTHERRGYATATPADALIEDLTEQYGVARDEFEVPIFPPPHLISSHLIPRPPTNTPRSQAKKPTNAPSTPPRTARRPLKNCKS